jgi:hypothetical protein
MSLFSWGVERLRQYVSVCLTRIRSGGRGYSVETRSPRGPIANARLLPVFELV